MAVEFTTTGEPVQALAEALKTLDIYKEYEFLPEVDK